MTPLWTSDEVIRATNGKGVGHWEAERICIDSRKLQPGDLFVALKGETFDGHDYVKEAFTQGAVAALVSYIPAGMSADNLVLVKDTLEGLCDLARASRARSDATIVAVTGSVGKTGTKEALKAALSTQGKVYATTGNLNNHIGLPLTLANMPVGTRFGIFEMGMNHADEIRPLTKIARPHVCVITNVEAVHLEFFASTEEIADAKAEILEGMDKSGVAILNIDNAHFKRLKAKAQGLGIAHIVSFGTNEHADCRLNACVTTENGSEVLATINGTQMAFAMGTIGKHWGLTAAAALAVVDALSLDMAKAAEAFATFSEPEGRGKPQRLSLHTGAKITLIDDSYNASPASVNAALQKLKDMKQLQAGSGRTVAVLGDMLELGENSARMHVELMPSLINNQIDIVFTAGQFMKQLYESLPEAMKGEYAADALTLAPKVVGALRHRDIVLVKGSNGSKMKEVVKAIVNSTSDSMEDKSAL